MIQINESHNRMFSINTYGEGFWHKLLRNNHRTLVGTTFNYMVSLVVYTV